MTAAALSILAIPVRLWTEERAPVIRVVRRFQASPERVFAAWLDARTAGRWLFATASQPIAHVEIDARVGGGFRFVERRRGKAAQYTGRYLAIVPPRRLVFTLAGAGRPTRVTVDVAPRRDGCELALSHAHVPADAIERTDGRWTGILYGLGIALGEST